MAGLVALAALTAGAQAAPLVFSSGSFDVTAVAAGDGAPGFESQSSPPTATPLSASASSGVLDIATAGAIAGPGLLTTSADATAGSGIASSVATAHFLGSFLNNGRITLNIDFLSLDSASGSGDAGTALFVLLTSGGVTLFQDFISSAWQFHYSPVLGSTSVLDLTLSSQVGAGFPNPGAGSGSGFGLVAFDGTVPETPTLLLVSLSLALMAALKPTIRHKP